MVLLYVCKDQYDLIDYLSVFPAVDYLLSVRNDSTYLTDWWATIPTNGSGYSYLMHETDTSLDDWITP